MTTCEHVTSMLFGYLDGELRRAQALQVEAHVRACESCREALEGRRQFRAGLGCARLEIQAPPQLRARIEAMVKERSQGGSAYGGGVFRRALEALGNIRRAAPQWAAATLLLATLVSGVWWFWMQSIPRSAFAVAAVKTHENRLRGQVPLQFASSSPEAISDWFQGRVPFHVKLPAPGEAANQRLPYQLIGAAVVTVDNERLGYVAYELEGKPVSLVITSASAAKLDGRKQIPMKSLVIHYDKAGDLNVVTWAVPKKGVTYALISEKDLHPNQSCIVCHAEAKDRQFMSDLVGMTI